MSAQVYDITLGTMGRGVSGFRFSVLGDLIANGSDYTRRSQGENNVFTADYNNNPLISGVEYKFEVYHPDYAQDLPLLRYTFDIDGNLIPSSPAEDPINAPGYSADVLDTVTGRSPDASAVLETNFFTAWLPQEAGNFLLRKIATASVWVLLINALTEALIDALKEKLTYALDDLTELDTDREITITNADGSATVLTSGGIKITESDESFSFFGRTIEGAIGFIGRAGQSFLLSGGAISTDVSRISAALADTIIRSLTLSELLPATIPTGILVTQPGATEGFTDVRGYSLEDFATIITPLLDYEAIKEGLSDVPGDARLPHQILCYDAEEPVLLTQDFVITPAKINVLQPHRLSIPGASIFPTLISDDNRDATGYMSVSFPDSTHYLITPDTGHSADFYGKLNLRTILP